MPKQNFIEPRKVKNHGSVSWVVTVPKDIAGNRQRKFFSTKGEAEEFASTLQEQRQGSVSAFLALSREDQVLLMEAYKEAGSATEVMNAVKLHGTAKPKPIKLSELIKRCCHERQLAKYTKNHLYNLQKVYAKFLQVVGDKESHEVSTEDVSKFVYAGELEPESRESYLRKLRTLFNYGRTHKHVLDNPAAKVKAPVRKDRSIPILTPEDAERLMLRAQDDYYQNMVPYFAACLFLGLRPSEAMKIKASDFREDYLIVLGKRSGTRKRRLVALNDAFKAWVLEPVNITFTRKMFHRILERCVVGDRGPLQPLPWHQDCMRHSFVSYHYALHGGASTAKEAGHSEAVMHGHYKELVTKKDAERFFAIRPAKEFYKATNPNFKPYQRKPFQKKNETKPIPEPKREAA